MAGGKWDSGREAKLASRRAARTPALRLELTPRQDEPRILRR